MEHAQSHQQGWLSSLSPNSWWPPHKHRPFQVPPHAYAAIQETLKQYNDTRCDEEEDEGAPHNTFGDGETHTAVHVVEFRRDEIQTGNVLTLEPEERPPHHTSLEKKASLVAYHSVDCFRSRSILGISTSLPTTEGGMDSTTVASGNHPQDHPHHPQHHHSTEEEDEHYNPIYLNDHQQANGVNPHSKSVPHHQVATDEEDARPMPHNNNNNNSQPSTHHHHQYMLKQVIPPEGLWQQLNSIYSDTNNHNKNHKNDALDHLWCQVTAHLVHECQLLRSLQQQQHPHTSIISLRGMVRGGANVFLDSDNPPQWDSYFLVADAISETLAQRLQRWKYHDDETTYQLSGMGQDHSHTNSDDVDDSGDHSSLGESSLLAQWLVLPHQHQQNQHTRQKNTMTTTTTTTAPVDTTTLDFRTRLVYAQQLASALAFLHSRGIMVRNLHPELIGFSASNDTIQIMDLGQALQVFDNDYKEEDPNNGAVLQQQQQQQQQSPTVVASTTELLQQQSEHALFRMTPGRVFRYMAPELLTTLHPKPISFSSSSSSSGHFRQQQQQYQHKHHNHRGYSFKVDCYSWAMICFEMLTLSQPFAALNHKPGQHLVKVCLQPNKHRSLRPHLEVYRFPPVLCKVLTRAWHQDAAKRCAMEVIHQRVLQILSSGSRGRERKQKE